MADVRPCLSVKRLGNEAQRRAERYKWLSSHALVELRKYLRDVRANPSVQVGGRRGCNTPLQACASFLYGRVMSSSPTNGKRATANAQTHPRNA